MATASSRTSTATGRAQESLPPIDESNYNTNSSNTSHSKETRSRGPSLGFLRRSRSTEPVGERKLSGRSKKKAQALEDERRQRETMMPKYAPRLPDLPSAPTLETFGGELEVERDDRPDSATMFTSSQPPSYRRDRGSSVDSPVASVFQDPYARTESMAHRGRYSYASSAVSTSKNPRRLRRRKDPTPYNILVIGARNSGKTSFLNFLRKSLTMPPHKHPIRTPEELEDIERYSGSSDGYTSHYLETEIDGERVGLTLWDSTGLERSIVDIQLRGVTGFLEGKFEETLREETKVIRSPGVRDTHIHCTFLVLDPVRLDENIAAAERAAQGTPKASDSPVVGILDKYLDLQVLRTVLGKTTVVPIISKADTITTAHMAYLRKAVWDSLKKANIDPLEVLTLEDQEEYTSSESADEEVILETQTEHVSVPERVPEPVPEDVSEVEQNGESGNGEQVEQGGEDNEGANGDEAKEAVEPSGEESAENAEDAEKEAKEAEAKEAEAKEAEAKATEAKATEAKAAEAKAAEEAEAAQKLADEEAAAAELSRKSGSEAVAQNLPFAILSPDPHTLASDDEPVGRRFAWGFADPYNPEHCDFVKLKNSVFSDWRSELREASRVIWYENWRTSLLNHNGVNVVPQKKTFGGRSAPFDGRRTR